MAECASSVAHAVSLDTGEICGEFDLWKIKRMNLHFWQKYISESVTEQINFCMSVGLLPKTRHCGNCRRQVNLVKEGRPDHGTSVMYRCFKRSCQWYGKYISIRDGTVFEGSKLSVGDVLHFMVLYLGGCTAYERIQHEWVDVRGKMLSKETIYDWLTYFREIQLEELIRNSTGKTGSSGYKVEIDESKFGKRKYNRGRVIEGQWVVGGICRETKEIFVSLCPDNKCDSTTLLSIIEQHVDSAWKLAPPNGKPFPQFCGSAIWRSHAKRWKFMVATEKKFVIDTRRGYDAAFCQLPVEMQVSRSVWKWRYGMDVFQAYCLVISRS